MILEGGRSIVIFMIRIVMMLCCDDMYLTIFKTVLCRFLSLSVRQNTAFVEKEFLATNVKVSFTFDYDLRKAFLIFFFLDFFLRFL